MAVNTTPIFLLTPVSPPVLVSTANTNLDGSGTLATLVTAATNGTRIDAVRIKAIETTTAGMIRFFIHNGTAAFLHSEVAVTAITPNATTKSFESTWRPDLPIVLPTGYSLRASTENGEDFHLTPWAGSYN